MGANLANTVAEALSARLAALTSGRQGLRILSNLADGRLAQVSARLPASALCGKDSGSLSGAAIAEAIAEASLFAERDPYRAVTHNKGIMNGLDSVVLATGNDYRAVEAGAHAWAARHGRYEPLGKFRVEGDALVCELTVPLSLGIVGGTLKVHPTARLCLALAEVESAGDLALLAAAAGLASNLAALRALSTAGIQRGHMSLHARSVAVEAGATGAEVEAVAQDLRERGEIHLEAARASLLRLRSATERP